MAGELNTDHELVYRIGEHSCNPRKALSLLVAEKAESSGGFCANGADEHEYTLSVRVSVSVVLAGWDASRCATGFARLNKR